MKKKTKAQCACGKCITPELEAKIDKLWKIHTGKSADTSSYLATLKKRFGSMPDLHKGIAWDDVEAAFIANPEIVQKLQILDEKGHEMNVVAERNGEYVFMSCWTNVDKVSSEHKDVTYAQAVEIVKDLGVELADPRDYITLLEVTDSSGWRWLATGKRALKAGFALYGNHDGFFQNFAGYHCASGSFCAALRVKKA